MSHRPGSSEARRLAVFEDGSFEERRDAVTTEEPLEIRLVLAGRKRTVAVSMRTPGADFELAAGFLFGEGVIASRRQIVRMSYCIDADVDPEQQLNIVNVELEPSSAPNLEPLERHFFTTSACGVCGKASLDALALRSHPLPVGEQAVDPEIILTLPDKLRSAQGLWQRTGGLHAAALFDGEGAMLALREDVGRHNALDKLVGRMLLDDRLPLSEQIVMVSGRTSFEILQKSLAAGAPMVCAVSAPSTLAVDLAERFGITLIGFLRNGRFNVYTGGERLRGAIRPAPV
jgi:FdhD protein